MADLNGDGREDLVTAAASYGISVLMANSYGFASRQIVITDVAPSEVVVGDFTGDGIPDIVAGRRAGKGLSFVRGNGDGTFGSVLVSSLTVHPTSIAAADFDEDGNLDVAVAAYDENAVLVLRGNGAGAFTEAWRITATGTYRVVVGDFDGDANRDIAYSAAGNQIGVAFGNGATGFETSSVATATNLSSILAADANGDGRTDLLTFPGATLTLYLAGPSRTFGAATSFASCLDGYVSGGQAFGDVTGDGNADVVAGTDSFPSPRITIWPGNGAGGFGAPFCYAVADQDSLSQVALTDLDSDGRKDIVVLGHRTGASTFLGLEACGKTNVTLGASSMPVAGDDARIEVRLTPTIVTKPAPTGTVTLKEGDTILGQGDLITSVNTGSRTFTVAGITAGTHQYTIEYSGDDLYYPRSAIRSLDVAPSQLGISIAGPAESTYGDSAIAQVTFDTTSYLDTELMKVSLKCGSWSSYPRRFDFQGCGAGEHTLVVSYKGDSTVPRGTASFTHTIRKKTPELVVTPPQSIATTGNSATATWTVGVGGSYYGGQPTGTVTLMQGDTVIGSITVPTPSSIISTTLPIGTHAGFYATYSGDANHESAQSSPTSVTVYYSGPGTLKALYRNGQVTFQYQFPNGTVSAHFYRERAGGGITEVPPGGEAMTSGIHLYWYTAHDASGMTIATTQKEVVVAMNFTDEDLSAGAIVKAVHFNDILTGANLLRSATGLAPVTLEALTPGVTLIKRTHVTTLRDAINQGRINVGAQPFPFTDNPLGTQRPIRLVHILQLRDALR